MSKTLHNYTFIYRIFSSSDKLIAQLYTQALNNLESLAKKLLVTGFFYAGSGILY